MSPEYTSAAREVTISDALDDAAKQVDRLERLAEYLYSDLTGADQSVGSDAVEAAWGLRNRASELPRRIAAACERLERVRSILMPPAVSLSKGEWEVKAQAVTRGRIGDAA